MNMDVLLSAIARLADAYGMGWKRTKPSLRDTEPSLRQDRCMYRSSLYSRDIGFLWSSWQRDGEQVETPVEAWGSLAGCSYY